MKKVTNKISLSRLVLHVLVLVAGSCTEPGDKLEYLDKFEMFVDRVEENSGSYKKSDWEWADARFEKFSRGWYSKFSDDLNSQEHIKVVELRIRYRALKTGNDLQKLKEALRDGAEDVREDLRKYLDNHADEDLEALKEGARAIGDSAVKVMEDIINALGKKK